MRSGAWSRSVPSSTQPEWWIFTACFIPLLLFSVYLCFPKSTQIGNKACRCLCVCLLLFLFSSCIFAFSLWQTVIHFKFSPRTNSIFFSNCMFLVYIVFGLSRKSKYCISSMIGRSILSTCFLRTDIAISIIIFNAEEKKQSKPMTSASFGQQPTFWLFYHLKSVKSATKLTGKATGSCILITDDEFRRNSVCYTLFNHIALSHAPHVPHVSMAVVASHCIIYQSRQLMAEAPEWPGIWELSLTFATCGWAGLLGSACSTHISQPHRHGTSHYLLLTLCNMRQRRSCLAPTNISVTLMVRGEGWPNRVVLLHIIHVPFCMQMFVP